MQRLHFLALFLIGSLVVFGISWSPQASAENWLPELTDSASLPGDAFVNGTAVRSDGKPFAEGSRVILYAYPSQATMEALKVGDSFTTTPVGKAFVGPGGSVAVRIAPVKGVSGPMTKAGNTDFLLRAFDGTEMTTEYFSRPAGDVASALAGRATPTQVKMVGQANPALAEVSPDNPAMESKTDVCGEDYVQNLGQVRVTAGRTSTPNQTSWMSLSLTTGSDSHLGVGTSVSGQYGSFQAGGTVARSASVNVNFGQAQGWYQDYIYLSYGKFAQWCYPVYSDYAHRWIYNYVARATSGANGGNTAQKDTATSANYCAALGPKVQLSKTNTNAATFGGGVEISAVIGIDLSARTGYSSSSVVTVKNTATNQTKQLCGSNGYFSGTPENIRIIS